MLIFVRFLPLFIYLLDGTLVNTFFSEDHFIKNIATPCLQTQDISPSSLTPGKVKSSSRGHPARSLRLPDVTEITILDKDLCSFDSFDTEIKT
jgi:hypothetical protein